MTADMFPMRIRADTVERLSNEHEMRGDLQRWRCIRTAAPDLAACALDALDGFQAGQHSFLSHLQGQLGEDTRFACSLQSQLHVAFKTQSRFRRLSVDNYGKFVWLVGLIS
jgi:hypothetical protein